MENNKRIIFFGTPEFSSAQLENIFHSGFDVAAVVTVPDKPAGRGKKLQQSDVKITATRLNIPVLQPEKLKDEAFIKELAAFNASVFVVIAFRMLPEIVWRMPKFGTFNLHASMLPQYRGAAPINRAIMNGETQTGLTTFFLNANIDEGSIINQIPIEIGNNETAGELHDRMIELGKPLVINTLNLLFEQSVRPVKQSIPVGELIKSAPKIFKQDCVINWNRPIIEIFNQVRGLSPYPAAVSTFISSEKQQLGLKIYEASIEAGHPNETIYSVLTDNKKYLKIALPDGYLKLTNVQQPGKRSMDIDEFLRGFQFVGEWYVSDHI
ncbi:MAG: methionyl-tRNA formyltransferase [Bacteroidales bacterium]|nr:methionyl-tRNA formyltransferase [Bacteroidales bacterium]